MAIQLATNFKVNTQQSLDSRYVVANTAARNAIASGVRFDGLIVYQLDTSTEWQLQGGTTTWVNITGGGTGDVNGGTWI